MRELRDPRRGRSPGRLAGAPLLAALLGLATAAACSGGPHYEIVSPTTPQGPPKFMGPPELFDAPPPGSAAALAGPVELAPGTGAPAAAGPLPSPVFVHTADSDEWVSKTLQIQAAYTRVLVVNATGTAPATVVAGKLALNDRDGKEAPEELKVDRSFRTLQEAADAAQGGDLVAVLPGSYAGFYLGDKPSAADGKYIHFKALGPPGDVVIDRPNDHDKNWMILLQAAHHVIVQGFNLAGSSLPGQPAQGTPNAGLFLDGDFGRSGKETHHVVIDRIFCHNQRKYGMHSTDSHTVLIQDSFFGLSGVQHSAYISDGSDNYVIRRNVFFGSPDSGLQCNVDPLASLDELLTHPTLAGFAAKVPTHAWAAGLLAFATEKFGANNFPDGRGLNFLIEENVMNGNGKGGGGAINLAGVQDSIVQNNLLYGNLAHGIAQWDNANPYDAALVSPGPRTAADVPGPEALPMFGCHGNLIRNNTVLMATAGRYALQSVNGSWGTRSRNNVLVNDLPASMEVSNTAIYRWDAGYNVLDAMLYTGVPIALRGLALATVESNHSTLGVTRTALASQFVRYGEEPWVVFEGSWWKLNPQRPDFHPRAGAVTLKGRGDPKDVPARDLEGVVRTGADIGAFVAK